MSGLIFNEEALLQGNIFRYESRLKSSTNRYVEGGAMLTTYYNIKENATTVDRGIRDIEQLFGHKSPLRFNKIENFPVYGFGQANPANSDETGIEDINLEGECIILPSTIVPNPNDFFIINHLKMKGVFQIVEVTYDSMKVEGYYKIRYRLHSTSEETLNNLEKQTIENYHTDLDAIGTEINPIIRKDNFIKRSQIHQMVNQMVESYKSLFYNERHNCFLFNYQEAGTRWFDICGNEFIAKHSLMNILNSSKVIILHDKMRDSQLPFYYNNSIYNWIELGVPDRFLQKFHFTLSWSEGYRDSSFARWSDHDVQIIHPIPLYQVGLHHTDFSYFDDTQINAFMDNTLEPTSEFEKLIWRYIHNSQSLSIDDISLYTADTLLSSIKHIDVFFYTPLVLFIIRQILRMN